MAEFKLERFKYNWRGDWQASYNYDRDDVVRYGGKSYVCLATHTSDANFYTDLDRILPDSNPPQPDPRWTVMTDARQFVGTWTPGTFYRLGDIVTHTGSLWICVKGHTASAFENNQNDWTLFADGIGFVGDWSAGTNYGRGAVVRYGSIKYKCVTAHTSQALLETDIAKWEVYTDKNEYAGAWALSTTYYKNDFVKYGGSIFKVNTTHTPESYFEEEKFDLHLPGFQFNGVWSNSESYEAGDIVEYGGYMYYALRNSSDQNPSSTDSTLYWQLMSKTYNFRGDWNPSNVYLTGDLVRRGGRLEIAVQDVPIDGSTLDYESDIGFWEVVVPGQLWNGSWTLNEEYGVGDMVIYYGELYECKTGHVALANNYPGDNGSGYDYWTFVAQSGTEAGLGQPGDLLTYDLRFRAKGDGSTFGAAAVPIGVQDQLLSINSDDSVVWRNYLDKEPLVIYVSNEGIDATGRGTTYLKPFKTIRYACEYVEDNIAVSRPAKISIKTGRYEETLPMIVPALTVVMGDELRSTSIYGGSALSSDLYQDGDLNYTVIALNRIVSVLQQILANTPVEKTTGNNQEQVFQALPADYTLIQGVINALISDISGKVEYQLGVGGFDPTISSTNDRTSDANRLNTSAAIFNNTDFLVAEAIAFVNANYNQYNYYDAEWFEIGLRSFLRAWRHDLQYPGNYQSVLAARRWANSVSGSRFDDMFYLRDATGVRNATIGGLDGTLNPPGVFDLYQRPTGGSFCSLDPGWGPDDDRTWILTRSPYIQGVTTIGSNCTGQKIDGALHNGGNKSMVSNDFTQVLSDGVGAWVTNNGRAELVSVFTYYCSIGYLAENGGKIRAANGNNSYGVFGAIADGVDDTEIPREATINNRNQQAIVQSAFAGEITDEIIMLQYAHAGEAYTQATANILGSGNFADLLFDDFRDGGFANARVVSAEDSSTVGGAGYLTYLNNAQSGDATSLILAASDPGTPANYQGMRIVLVSGDGTGQYGIVDTYNDVTKLCNVVKESDGTPGFDHYIPGKAAAVLLTSNTQYRIEPKITCNTPAFSRSVKDMPSSQNWQGLKFGTETEVYENIELTDGTGSTVDVVAEAARITITRRGDVYSASLIDPGFGYAVGDTLVVSGNNLGGTSPLNDCTITVTGTTDDSSNSITTYTVTGTANTGMWIAVSNGIKVAFSYDGDNWDEREMPESGNWTKIANGTNRFVAIKYELGNTVALSSDGITWTSRNIPTSIIAKDIAFGNGTFVILDEDNSNVVTYSTNGGFTWSTTTIPDSTTEDSTGDQWQAVVYARNKFLAISGSTRSIAESTDGITWTRTENVLPNNDYDWAGLTYGRNTYVAISKNNGASVTSTDGGASWNEFAAPSLDDSTPFNFQEVEYSHGVFVAVGDTGQRDVFGSPTDGTTTFVFKSLDGVKWTALDTQLTKSWSTAAGVSQGSPYWLLMPYNDNVVIKANIGAEAIVRPSITQGKITSLNIIDPGSGYTEEDPVVVTIFDTTFTVDLITENRIGNGVLANPSFLNRGIGYRTSSTQVTIDGDGYAEIIPESNQLVLNGLEVYPRSGSQLLIDGVLDTDTENPDDLRNITAVIVTPLGDDGSGNGTFKAQIQISPTVEPEDNLQHGTTVRIRERYSQCRITGHDFLDIGTGNFLETNYPDLYAGGAYFTAAPENEVYEEDGGRVFYVATDQDGNFRTGELFSVEQATGIVTISAEYFDLDGLSELSLGGIRVGGSGVVVREFSTDPTFSEDSNNVIPTQRAIASFLAAKLSEGGQDIETNDITAGTIRIGTSDNTISNTADLEIKFPVGQTVLFDGVSSSIGGSYLGMMMFLKSFNNE